MSVRAATKVGYEPIPGYTLRKRIGAGGYGEVWLADAPGGLQKAIKLIYGTVDQSHATSELRSLQRIRQVYHPFLLSLERIEIVDNQVIIVTELAESSLLDRFEQCKRKGMPGIERATLLDFLRDTSDALDFLAQKHSLQHLDVKPGNLLIIADRIKVADFGLIKDLHDQNQSLVSGLTPTYSAPEIFDGRPDYRSDQYSLAIVYTEMLTGQLPFNGSTTGELARQHLQQAPNLESLPPADRPVVARALSKNPLDRFASCRLFVEQLLKSRGAVLPVSPARVSLEESNDESITTGSASELLQTSSAPALNGRQQLQPALDVSDLSKHWNNPHAMFIGLGGLGCQSLAFLRKQMNTDCDNRLGVDDHAWTAIDTCSLSLDRLTNEQAEDVIPARYAFELKLYRPSEYRDANQELFHSLSRRWLYNIPRSLKTEGVRPLAILTLLDHYDALRNRLYNLLRDLVAKHTADNDCNESLRIYLLSSIHGGTGGGLICEMGFLLRRILLELNFSDYRICAIASAATTTNNQNANLQSAAAIATLSEFAYLMDEQTEVAPIHYSDRSRGTTATRPFDWVTLVDGGLYGSQTDVQRAVREMANVAWLDSQTMSGQALAESRSAGLAKPRGWLRTSCAAPIKTASHITTENLSRWCAEQTLSNAVTYMTGPKGSPSSSLTGNSAGRNLPTVSGDLPLTPQATDDFNHRLLEDLGVIDAVSITEALENEERRNLLLRQWARRLSGQDRIIEEQLRSDIQLWKTSIARVVRLRVYNWKQIEQIQLNVIEGILDFCEHQAAQFVALLEPLSGGQLGSREQMLGATVGYMNRFSEECMRLLKDFQADGRALAKKVRSWSDSINAEKALNAESWDLNLIGLPPRLQMLTQRVNSVLESTVHQMALQIVDDAAASARDKLAPLKECHRLTDINLRHIITLASDLIVRVANELGITASELNSTAGETSDSVSLQRVESLFPAFSQGGGRLFRFLVTPSEHVQVVLKELKSIHLDSSTTIVPSRRSLESHVMCDATDISMARLTASLWRPSEKTLQLAERLRTRSDIDWPSVTFLLENNAEEGCGIVLPTSAVAPQTEASDINTAPLFAAQ
jgi:serine/threonine protein kinase